MKRIYLEGLTLEESIEVSSSYIKFHIPLLSCQIDDDHIDNLFITN